MVQKHGLAAVGADAPNRRAQGEAVGQALDLRRHRQLGVFQLARYHPQVISDSQEIPISRGSTEFTDGKKPTTGSIRITETVAKVWPDPPVKDEERPKR